MSTSAVKKLWRTASTWLVLQGTTNNQGLFCNNWKLRESRMIRSQKKKKEVRFLLIYHAIIALRSLTYTASAALGMQLHWAFPGWGPTSHALRYTLTSYRIRKDKAQSQPVRNEVIIYCFKKKNNNKTVLWTLWLCAKRCFRSEGGHTASTAFLPQKKEPTTPYTSQLIKAVLFLETETCVSANMC